SVAAHAQAARQKELSSLPASVPPSWSSRSDPDTLPLAAAPIVMWASAPPSPPSITCIRYSSIDMAFENAQTQEAP
ncbi:unnamed protein product, partial [Ilex paraguariensis]